MKKKGEVQFNDDDDAAAAAGGVYTNTDDTHLMLVASMLFKMEINWNGINLN
jgi:hypothetical protein